jgi:hypothetical protein
MDPDACLKLIRASVRRIEAMYLLDDNEAATLAVVVNNLDEWLTKGGFVPQDWDHCPCNGELPK